MKRLNHGLKQAESPTKKKKKKEYIVNSFVTNYLSDYKLEKLTFNDTQIHEIASVKLKTFRITFGS